MVGKNNMIAGIILAAGKGTRIQSTTSNKVTLTFLNKPMIVYGVELLKAVADPVIVVVGAFAESVKDALKGYDVIFASQPDQLGTAHAAEAGLQALKGTIDPDSLILVGYGDHMMFYSVKNANDLVAYHKKQQAVVTIVTTTLDIPEGYGRVMRNESSNVIGVVEQKDATDEQRKIKEINAGLYCFDYGFIKENIDQIEKSPVTDEYYLPDLIKIANKQGKKVAGFAIAFKNVGIGVNKPEELTESQKIYLKNKNSDII